MNEKKQHSKLKKRVLSPWVILGGMIVIFFVISIVFDQQRYLSFFFNNQNKSDNRSPSPIPTLNILPVGGKTIPADTYVDKAAADLSGRLGIQPEQISVVSVEEKQWPDSSLGCPQKDHFYNQVIIPGFRIVLKVNNTMYTYHAGSQIVLSCNSK